MPRGEAPAGEYRDSNSPPVADSRATFAFSDMSQEATLSCVREAGPSKVRPEPPEMSRGPAPLVCDASSLRISPLLVAAAMSASVRLVVAFVAMGGRREGRLSLARRVGDAGLSAREPARRGGAMPVFSASAFGNLTRS